MYVRISEGGMKSPNVITELSQATNCTHTSPLKTKREKFTNAVFPKVDDLAMRTSLCLNTVNKLHTKLADASVRLKPAVSIAAFKSGSVMYSSRISAPANTVDKGKIRYRSDPTERAGEDNSTTYRIIHRRCTTNREYRLTNVETH